MIIKNLAKNFPNIHDAMAEHGINELSMDNLNYLLMPMGFRQIVEDELLLEVLCESEDFLRGRNYGNNH